MTDTRLRNLLNYSPTDTEALGCWVVRITLQATPPPSTADDQSYSYVNVPKHLVAKASESHPQMQIIRTKLSKTAEHLELFKK